MHKAFSLSPSEKTLTRIETLLETIYDQVQALRDERSQSSQAWFWTPEIQAEIRKAEQDIENGDTKIFSHPDELLKDLHAHVQA